jgi:tetratricopeptide (TPR) repeat protein
MNTFTIYVIFISTLIHSPFEPGIMSEIGEPSVENINQISVRELSKSIQRCEGYYSFLIGAGSSKQAGIPTSSELIWRWKSQRYHEEFQDVDEISDAEITEWSREIEEKEMAESKNEYGFWFEKQHTTRGERRKFVREMVKDKDPTFGHIVLASMMKDGIIPVTLTTNFDDLLYDAFYLFLEEKPLLIDHNAIAPEYQVTQERPSIIKLHGDYLYDNLKNTTSETSELEKNMQNAFSRTLSEYGMVVVGYGGEDRSIMNFLNSEEIEIPDYGLFWCGLDISNLSEDAIELLQEPNTFFVEIDGFESLLSTLYSDISNIDIPMPHEINRRAQQREQKLLNRVTETEGTESLEYRMQAQAYSSQGDYESAIGIYTSFIEQRSNEDDIEGDPRLHTAYSQRAMNYARNGQYQEAIDDYQKAISIGPDLGDYLNIAEVYLLNEKPEKVLEYVNRIPEEASEEREVISAMLKACAKILLEENHEKELHIIKQSKAEEVPVMWEFSTLLERLDYLGYDDEKVQEIRDLIDMVKPMADNTPERSTLSDFADFTPAEVR